jgi:hypothetical protein
MSTNIKLNPFNLVGTWNDEGLTAVATELAGTPSTIQELAEIIATWVTEEVLYSSTQVAPIDKVYTIGMVAFTTNTLSTDSWCKDCCDNTFTSFDKMKKRINEMGGFSPAQLSYINQIIGMPCNYNLEIEDFGKTIEQLETAVLTDTNMSQQESASVLLIIAVSKYALNYWITETANPSSVWVNFFTPLAPEEYIRPFWLSGVLGTIVVMMSRMGDPSMHESLNTNLSTSGLVGAISGAASYVVFK